MGAHYLEVGQLRQFLRNQSGGISHSVTRRRVAFAICALAVVGIALYLVLRPTGDTPSTTSQTAAPRDAVTSRTPIPNDSQPRPTLPTTDAASGSGSATTQSPPMLPNFGARGPAERAIAQVDDAFSRGDLNKARTLAAKVLEQNPTEPHMLQVMAYIACAHRELKEARNYYGALTDPADRARVQSMCKRRGVDIDAKP
jgi:hypothetical protein